MYWTPLIFVISQIVIMDFFLGLAISGIVTVTLILIMFFRGWRPKMGMESFKGLSAIFLLFFIFAPVALRTMGIIESPRSFLIPLCFFMGAFGFYLTSKGMRKKINKMEKKLENELTKWKDEQNGRKN